MGRRRLLARASGAAVLFVGVATATAAWAESSPSPAREVGVAVAPEAFTAPSVSPTTTSTTQALKPVVTAPPATPQVTVARAPAKTVTKPSAVAAASAATPQTAPSAAPPAPTFAVGAGCASQTGASGGILEVCPASGPAGTKVHLESNTLCGSESLVNVTVVFGPSGTGAGDGQGGTEVPRGTYQRDGNGFSADWTIPAGTVPGAYGFLTYPADGCAVPFTVSS